MVKFCINKKKTNKIDLLENYIFPQRYVLNNRALDNNSPTIAHCSQGIPSIVFF